MASSRDLRRGQGVDLKFGAVQRLVLLLTVMFSSLEAAKGADDPTFSVDQDCFTRKTARTEQREYCLDQQAVVAQAALSALSKGEVQADDFGLLRFSFKGVSFACLRSGDEVRCLVLDEVR